MNVFTSNVIEHSNHPKWPLYEIPYSELTPSDRNDWPLIIQVFDKQSVQKDKYMGKIETTVHELMETSGKLKLSLFKDGTRVHVVILKAFLFVHHL